MLTKDIRKEKPEWSIWDDGWVGATAKLTIDARQVKPPENHLNR